jgi:hypothetical protein
VASSLLQAAANQVFLSGAYFRGIDYGVFIRALYGVGPELPDGMKGEVSGVNVLRQLVKVLVDVNDEKEMRECPVEELKFKPKHKKEKGKEKKKDRNSSGEQASSEEAKQPE